MFSRMKHDIIVGGLRFYRDSIFFYLSSFWFSSATFRARWTKLNTLALTTERQSARMSKIKNDGLDQYGAGPFEQQQFGTAGIEGVNYPLFLLLS